MTDLTNRAIELLQMGQMDQAAAVAVKACEAAPGNYHSWYALGICQRAKEQFQMAVQSLQQANRLQPDQQQVLLALGIAQQMGGDLDAALATMKRLVERYPEYVLGYNSLGMTLKLLARPADAAEAYDYGAKVLARNWAEALTNRPDSPRLPHWTSRNSIWMRYALWAALTVAVVDGMEAIATPTGESALEEARTKSSRGYYWLDHDEGLNGKRIRAFQPNYFNSLAAYLRADKRYANLVGNRSTVLTMLGEEDEARMHLEEAQDFSP